jgi:hypothetical protein
LITAIISSQHVTTGAGAELATTIGARSTNAAAFRGVRATQERLNADQLGAAQLAPAEGDLLPRIGACSTKARNRVGRRRLSADAASAAANSPAAEPPTADHFWRLLELQTGNAGSGT